MGKIHEQITNEHFSSLTDENQKKDKMYMIKSNNFSQELEKPFPRPSSDVSLILDSKFHLSFRKWRNN